MEPQVIIDVCEVCGAIIVNMDGFIDCEDDKIKCRACFAGVGE